MAPEVMNRLRRRKLTKGQVFLRVRVMHYLLKMLEEIGIDVDEQWVDGQNEFLDMAVDYTQAICKGMDVVIERKGTHKAKYKYARLRTKRFRI
jgi:hypothetical protein